jgi:hypothetical protein
VGRYLEVVEPEIEVTPAPVGLMALIELGTLIGRRAAIRIGEHRHHANLFGLIVGETSTGGKGSADAATERLVHEVDSSFPVRHVVGGFDGSRTSSPRSSGRASTTSRCSTAPRRTASSLPPATTSP